MLYILFSNIDRDFSCDYIQQTGRILGEKHTVLVAYYQKPYSWMCLWKNPAKLYEIIGKWRNIITASKFGGGVYECEFISLLPFQHNYLIYRLNRILSRFELNILILIRRLVQRVREEVVLWIFHPTAEFFVGKMAEKTSIYDIVDYLEVLASEKENLHALEKKLLEKVDFVFANSGVLAETKKKMRYDIRVVPCGCNIENFPSGYQPKIKPKFLEKIQFPIAGFIGTLDYRIDYKLLKYLLEENPNYSFVFIGVVLDKSLKDIKGRHFSINAEIGKLKKYPNFYLLNNVAKDDLKDYLYFFTVGLIPYNVNYEVVKYCNPMKLYEYFAMGLPIVSIPIASIIKYRIPTLIFGQNVRKFNSSLKFLINNRDLRGNYRDNMREIVLLNSWKEKVNKIISFAKI